MRVCDEMLAGDLELGLEIAEMHPEEPLAAPRRLERLAVARLSIHHHQSKSCSLH